MGMDDPNIPADPCAELPGLDEIFDKDVYTQEILGDGLLALAEREFKACVARVLQSNRTDAWDHEFDGSDSPERARPHQAWLELLIVSKACLPALPGGKAKANRNKNILATKLQRWSGGERAALWTELPERQRKSPAQTASESPDKEFKRRQKWHCLWGGEGYQAKRTVD